MALRTLRIFAFFAILYFTYLVSIAKFAGHYKAQGVSGDVRAERSDGISVIRVFKFV